MPYDQIDFSRVLDALATRGFVQKYIVDSVEYGFIPSFPRHQVINNRERPSELPDPTECNICDASTTRDSRVTTRDQSCKEEGKGKEGKGKEYILSFSDFEESPKQPKKKPNPPEMIRIGKILGRRETTNWTAVEIAAFKQVDFVEDEILAVEAFYKAEERHNDPLHRRTGMQSLLNHWPDEVGKARNWAKKYGIRITAITPSQPLPPGFK